jgi:putative copper export protein/mono/diheme cytochrome c family protein
VFNGAVPPFDLEGGIALILARALTDTALLSAFGTLVFHAFVLPRALERAPPDTRAVIGRRLLRLTQGSLGLTLLGMVAWLVLQAGNMAGTRGLASSLAAVPTVLTNTFFGHLLAVQGAVALAAMLTLGHGRRPIRWRIAAGLSFVVTCLQASHGHAMAMYDGPSFLLLSEVLHLLGAGGWLGGLVPLAMVVRTAAAQQGAMAARWFSPLGKLCIALLAGSTLFQFWVLIGGLPGLVGTAYGWVGLVKLLLLTVLLGFAAANRYRFAPALRGQDAPSARRTLLRSIALQSGVGVLVLLAAAVISNLSPAMHIQAIWPFTEQFSLIVVEEDPDFRREVIDALMALAGAGALIGIGLLVRGVTRWIAVLAAATIIRFAVPHLDLLLVEAYPTSFYHSPTGFSTTTIASGAALFPQNCAACHGMDGRGHGPAAKGLAVPPADLTAEHLWGHSDGELFWWLSHGFKTPEGARTMPGFAGTLSDDQRWALIDYIRAHNAGLVRHDTGDWSPPLQAPDLSATCADGTSLTLAELRGHFVRLVFADDDGEGVDPETSSIRSGEDVATIRIGRDATAAPETGCLAADPAIWRAYAIVSGTPGQDMPGTQFLIDRNGWLRAAQHPSDASAGWNSPEALGKAIRTIASHPIAPTAEAHHHHE